ncbi:MAG: ABC transporter permease [Bryobacterales bacterium]|nr:ABC transporter permease [Bryobacterales bacterium]
MAATATPPRTARPAAKAPRNWNLLPLYAVFAYAFLHVPLLVLTVFSFNSSKFTRWEGFSWKWYATLFEDTRLVEATWNSLIIAAVATTIATIVGTLAAYALWKRKAPILEGSLYLSLVTPEIVTGVSLLAFFQWLFRYMDVRLGLHTVILAHVTFSIAYVVIVVQARLKTLDHTLEEAALDLGATEWEAFYRITLPLLIPGIVSAALLAFTISFDDYVITALVAGVDSETLPMVIYTMARKGVNPSVNAVSALIVVLLGFLILAAERIQQREP